MNEATALLFANEVFYRAFSDRDLEAVVGCWAEEGPVTCLHPGWRPLTTREEVLASFQAILEGPNPPEIDIAGAEAFLQGETGIVICYERIGRDVLVATNVFRREGARWRLVHHQAGPVNEPPPPGDVEPQPVN